MSTIIRGPDGKIKLYCKGADTVILERLGPNQAYVDATMVHLEVRLALKGGPTLSLTRPLLGLRDGRTKNPLHCYARYS